MLPHHHLILGVIFSIIIFCLFPQIGLIGFIIIIPATVLVDSDHYLYYVYKKKDLNLKNAYCWFLKNKKKMAALPLKQRKEFYNGVCLFHGIEILIFLFFLGKFFSIYFYYILLGFVFHLFLDIIYQLIYIGRMDKFSLVYDFFKFKKLKSID